MAEIVDLPMKHGDFPYSYVIVYQRVGDNHLEIVGESIYL